MNISENIPHETSLVPSPGMTGAATFRMFVRVAYHETDGQRRVHHANYLNYFEQSRVEMLRAVGLCYRDFEDAGLMLVVTEMHVRYRSAATFDDLLRIQTTITDVRGTRIMHRYVIDRDDQRIVDAESVIACISAEGKVSRLPKDWIQRFRGVARDAEPS